MKSERTSLPEPIPHRSDPLLFSIVLALVGLGLVMVYSSSAVLAQQKMGDSRYFLVRDLVWVLLGLVGMAVTMRIDYSLYRRLAYPILGVATLLLSAVLVVGSRVNGARRWFLRTAFVSARRACQSRSDCFFGSHPGQESGQGSVLPARIFATSAGVRTVFGTAAETA